MDSNLRLRPVAHSLAATTAQALSFLNAQTNPVRDESSVLTPQSPQTTTPTVEPTKEMATIKMDECIVSSGEVSTTKMKSDSDADNVPVSVSEEEEAQMESEDEEKDSKPAPMRSLVITNVKELTGIMHWNYNAAQYSTRMEKHRASPLNRLCKHSYGSTPGTHSASLITPMTYFPPRSHSRMSTEMTSAQRLIF